MLVIRYVVSVMIGIIAGTIWAAILVDFEPAYYEHLSTFTQICLHIIPIFVTFFMSACFQWWNIAIQAVYSFTVIVTWMLGAIHNDLSHTEGPLSVFFDTYIIIGAIALMLLMLSYYVGRISNRYLCSLCKR